MQPSKGEWKADRTMGRRTDEVRARMGSGVDDLAVPGDLVAIDQLLASLPSSAFGAAPVPAGLVDRVFDVSVSALPTPVIAKLSPANSLRFRYARLAMAAAIALAAAASALVYLKTGGVDTDALARGRETPKSVDAPGAPEATLVALLQPELVDDQAFTSRAARAVAPVLQTRGVQIEDFASELDGILGGDLSHSM